MNVAWVLAAMGLLAPGRDHLTMATAVSLVVNEQAPLFTDDADKRKTAALVTAVAFREGTFQRRVTGDKGRSFCTMQVHTSSGGSEALNEDPEACIRRGMELLRESLRVCPAHPIAWYASGPLGCGNERAQRISRDRMNLAGWIRRAVLNGRPEQEGATEK